MWEKHTGPGDLRSIYSKGSGLRVCALVFFALLLTLGGMAYPAHAQNEPAATLTVAGFEFSGNEAISSHTLAAVLQDVVGHDLTLLDLFEQAGRITRFYREQGFVVARAILPQQEVTDGIVRIEVLEGRYGDIALENASRLRDDVARRYLASLRSGDPIRYSALERPTLLLNDLPGVRAETTFRAGEQVGTSDLVVSLADRAPWSANLSFSNDGSGGLQSRLAGIWSNPSGLGDRLSLGVGSSPSGSLSGNAAYSVPMGGDGLITTLSYAASERRQSLGSTPIVTRSGTAGLRLAYPVKRTQFASQRIELGYDAQAERRMIGAVLADESHIARTTVEWRSERSLSGGGSVNYSLTATQGALRLAPDDALAADAASAQTAGAFTRLGAGAVMRRPVGTGYTLNIEMRGQMASKNLHASEKMGIAGVGGVRAYGGGAASGDQGWLVRSELQRGFSSPAWGLSGTGKVFADIGGVHVNRSPWAGSGGENVVGLAGIGGGLSVVRGNWSFDVINAYPIGQGPEGDAGGRLWLRAAWQY